MDLGMRTDYVEVKVSNRILHVGRQAYPLRNVTRVEPTTYTLRRGVIVKNFVREIGTTIFAALVILAGGSCAGASAGFYVIWSLALAGILAWRIHRLVRALSLPDLHVLRVETAGTAHTALINTDRDLIYDLADRVVEAIDNPAVEYRNMVNNYHVGDKVLGDKYGGDAVLGDKVAG